MSAPASTSSLMDVLHRGSDLVTSSSTPLLTGLPPEARVRLMDGAAVVGAEAGRDTARFDFALGQLNASRFVALGRTSLWWMTPKWGSSAAEVPEETQFLLAELPAAEGGQGGSQGYALLLPLIDGGTFRATLRPPTRSKDGCPLMARIESGAAGVAASHWDGAVLVAAGREPFELIRRGVAAAARLSGTARPRSEKPVPPSCDVFGWCSWDAFYSRVSAAGLQAGLKSLAEGGTAPRLLIIDDGWQRTDTDPQYRAAAAAGCAPGAPAGGVGLGSALADVEEAAAALVDPHLGEDLKGLHAVQREEAAEGAQAAAAAGGSAGTSTSGGGSSGGLLPTLAAWARAAYDRLAALAAHLEASLFGWARALLEATPASHWRMRLFSALVSNPLLRPRLLRFYASVSDHTRRLVSVRANAKFGGPEAGPEHALNSAGGDLAAVVAALKARHGLRYVYAWHAMFGFWGGLGLSDPEMQAYRPKLVMPTPTPGILAVDPAVAWVQPVAAGVALPADPAPLHADMHAYLAACGVDGVKVDVQSTTGLCGSGAGLGGGPATAAAYHASLEASIGRHFPAQGPQGSATGMPLINCMCHSTEDLYSFQHSNVARVSDDFYPRNPASWLAHLPACAFNSLLMGELAVPDWDMFHSKHEAALLHATARAVSGGPVYVSDRPGHHDHALLRRLVLPDGGLLRCSLPGRPTADCLMADPCRDGATALKVWNMNAVTGVVAAFNTQGSQWSRELRRFHCHDPHPPALAATVGPADVPPLAAAGADLYAAYVDGSQRLALLAPGERLELEVAGGGGSDVVCLSPVASAGGVAFAPLGLPAMLNAGGAVLGCALAGGHSDDGFEVQPARATLVLRGAGGVLCYASHRPVSVAVAGQEVPFTYDEAASALRFNLPVGEAASAAKEATVQF